MKQKPQSTAVDPQYIMANCVCRNCKLATPAIIPDPAAIWEKGMKAKPRIAGFQCHASRPAQTGFPPMAADQFCVYFTDANGNQPLRHLVSERRDA